MSRSLRVSLVAGLLAGVGLLASCGGGMPGVASNTSGGGSGVGSGGTGSYTSGTISGLGSIIVNGVRYDVSQASVIDDEGRTSYRTDVLDIGMTVEVTGGPASTLAGASRPMAAAAQVRFASALVGPVEVAPDAGCSCLTVLGQKVTYSVGTNMPELNQLTKDTVVEVYGRPDLAHRQLVATRIVLVTDGRPYKLQGWVPASGAVDTHNHTVSVYGPSQPPDADGSVPLVLGYSDSELVEPLTEARSGVRAVRVWFSPERTLLKKVALERPLVTDESEARLAGLVTATRDEQGMLAINGTWVNASALSSAVAAQLALGTFVQVEGQLVKGVLVVNEAGSSEEHEDELEVHGTSSDVTPLEGGSQATMVVIHDNKHVPVVFNLSGAPALSVLQGGVCVQVDGSGYDAQGRLVATEVELESSCH